MTRTCMALLACVLIVGSGCNTSSSGGSPGTADSFKINAPTIATNIKQGEKEHVKLSLTRGSDFKKTVDLKADAPTGIKVTMVNTRVASGEPAEFTITVDVDKSAPLGDHKIKITGTPESGNATSVDVPVKVTEGPKT
jgi:uncharacterized membrane protein